MSTEELLAESSENNPTIFSVYTSGMLHKMSVWESVAYSLIILLASAANVLCLMIVSRSTVFHANLQCPIWWTAFSWFALAVGKALIVTFQVVYLDKDYDPTSGSELITWSALAHYLFIFTAMCSPMIVVLERSYATICLFDYEKRRRRFVALTLFSLQNAFAVLFTWLTVANHLRYVSGAVLAGIIAAGSLIIFLHINRINTATLRYVERQNRDVKFDLSVRYQLRENVKTFKMLKTLFSTFTAMIVMMAVLKTLPMIMTVGEDTRYLFREITDMMVHAGPIYITITLVVAVDDYRRVFYRLVGLAYDETQVIPKTAKRDEDVYFEQFLEALR